MYLGPSTVLGTERAKMNSLLLQENTFLMA